MNSVTCSSDRKSTELRDGRVRSRSSSRISWYACRRTAILKASSTVPGSFILNANSRSLNACINESQAIVSVAVDVSEGNAHASSRLTSCNKSCNDSLSLCRRQLSCDRNEAA